jgi:hypothetical protein
MQELKFNQISSSSARGTKSGMDGCKDDCDEEEEDGLCSGRLAA